MSEKQAEKEVKEVKVTKKKPWLLICGGVVGLLVVVASFTVVVMKNVWERNSDLSSVSEQVNNYRDLQANTIGLSQRPFIQLLPQGNSNFSIRLNTLPLSAGDAEARIILPDGKEALTAHKIEFGIFPVTSEISYTGAGLAFLSTAFTGAPSYLVNQNFVYYKTGTKTVTSGDERFIIDGDDLKNASDILVLNSAGLPSYSEHQVVTASDPVNPDTASVPLAYQVSSSGSLTASNLTVTFVWQMPTVETPTVLPEPELSGSEAATLPPTPEPPMATAPAPTIYGYDSSTRRWVALETSQDNNIFQAQSTQVYDVFALML